MAYKKFYEETTCPDCSKTRLVRKWSNKTGICRSCSAKRRWSLIGLPTNFIRGEQIGKAPQTIYYWQECPQCHKPRWVRTNLSGVIDPTRVCYQCNGFNVKQSKSRQGERNGHWRGGRVKNAGYIRIYCPDHPRAVRRHVLEHILVWEKTHNQSLPKDWIIHHLNGKKDDNHQENLFAMPREKHSLWLYVQDLQRRIRELEGCQDIIDHHCVKE